MIIKIKDLEIYLTPEDLANLSLTFGPLFSSSGQEESNEQPAMNAIGFNADESEGGEK